MWDTNKVSLCVRPSRTLANMSVQIRGEAIES